MFTLSILLMALPTLAIWLFTTYAALGIAAALLLLLLRILQGAAIGGEVPGAWVFVTEHVPSRRIGFACGALTAGLTVGILLGSFVATLINQLLPASAIAAGGWRIPFFIGGVFGLCAMYLRRWLREMPIFIELQANSVAIIALAFGCIVAGVVIDRFGARKTFVAGCALLAITSWIFYHSDVTHPAQLYLTYGTAGFFVGIMGGVPFVMVHAFPAPVRFSCISFFYNIAYAIFGGLTPMVVTLLMSVTPMAPSWYVLALMGIALGFVLPGNAKRMLPSSDEAKAVL